MSRPVAEKTRFPLIDDEWERVVSIIPSTWCKYVEWRSVTSIYRCVVWYESKAEWRRPYKYGRKNYPDVKHDILYVAMPLGAPISFVARDNSLQVGPWKYRKRRGHTLVESYAPYGDERDLDAFKGQEELRRQRLICDACGWTMLLRPEVHLSPATRLLVRLKAKRRYGGPASELMRR